MKQYCFTGILFFKKHTMPHKLIQFISLFFCLYLLNINLNAQFQPVQVEKSTQKILLQGKVFYVHTVKQGQTMYSICKVYGVTQQDIASANPGETIDIIKPGQVLKIPDISNQSISIKTDVDKSANKFIFHTVQPKENAYFLSKKYNIPESAIYKYNPGSESGLQVGQVIKIPLEYDEPTIVSSTGKSDTAKVYVVKDGDTLYSIARDFGVTVADFINQNPDLRWGLKAGMSLQIPGKAGSSIISDSAIKDNADLIAQLTLKECDSIRNYSSQPSIKIALLLPFHSTELFSIDTAIFDTSSYSPDIKRIKALGVGSFEFYQGVLIAIDSLKKAKVNVTLFTYDTHSDTNQVKSILKELEIVRPNFIIGPFRNHNVSLVSDFSNTNKIPLILPLTKAGSGIASKNPFAIFMQPDSKNEIATFAEFVSKYNHSNIILIHHRDTNKLAPYNIFKENLISSGNSTNNNGLFKEVVINDTLRKNLNRSLRRDVENIIVVISNNEASVINIVSLLSIQSDHIKIKLFGMPSWQHFNNLQIEHLHKLSCILYSPFYIDENKAVTQSVSAKIRKEFRYEPYKTIGNGSNLNFTYLGFEAFLIFGNAYAQYGDDALGCICNIDANLPQSNYAFRPLSNGGFINNSINLIEFNPDYTLKCQSYSPLVNTSLKFPEETLESESINTNLPIE